MARWVIPAQAARNGSLSAGVEPSEKVVWVCRSPGMGVTSLANVDAMGHIIILQVEGELQVGADNARPQTWRSQQGSPGGYRIRPYSVGVDARHRPWEPCEARTFAGEQCPPLQILRYFLSFFSSSKYSASSSMSASVRVSVSARAATKLRGLPPKRRPHRLRLSAGRYAARVRAAV